MKRKLFMICAVAFLLCGLPQPTPALIVQEEESSVQFEVEQFTLPNGLRIYLNVNPQAPRFHSQIVVRAGGKNDPADATGIAHYLEHMLFKGTDELGTQDFPREKVLLDQITELFEQHFVETDEEKRMALQKQINQLSVEASQYAIPGEFDSLYSRLGVQGLNAYTSFEKTVYLGSFPKNRLEQWARVESERFKDPVFRLFQSELETVYEEKNRSMDNRDSILFNAVHRQLYKVHPYGTQTILGSVDHLKNPSLKKMYEFYHRYYIPNNMALVISGDLDIGESKRILTKYFSGWSKKPLNPFVAPEESPLKGVERVKTKYLGEEKVLLAFRTDKYHAKDRYALTLVDMLLDSGEAGLIKLNLVQPQKLRSAGSYPYILEDQGAQFLWAIPRKGQSLEEAEQLLLSQIEVIKDGRFSDEILRGIVLDFEMSTKKKLETNKGRVEIMVDSFCHEESIQEHLQLPQRLKEVSREEIIRVANKYFQGDYVSGWREDASYEFPKISKPELEKMKLNPNKSSDFARDIENASTEPITPQWLDYQKDYQVSSLAPGVLYRHVRNPNNDLFSLSIQYDFGDKHAPGFSNVMGELNNAGTGDLSAGEVTQKFFEMGVTAKFAAGKYSFVMSLSGLDSQLEKALVLAEQVLWNATLDEKRFRAKVDNVLASREDQAKNGKTLRQALRNYVRYGEDSPYLDRPAAAFLQSQNVADYPRYRDQLKKQNFKVSYSGQLDAEKVKGLLWKYHPRADTQVPLLHARKAPELKLVHRHEKPVQIYFLHNKGAQSHIDLVIPGELFAPSDTLMAEYYNAYMDGGMGAIMFQEVRESRALAYSTWSYFYQGSRLGDQDQMIAYIGTQADKSIDALTLFIELMRTPPRSQNHFDRARKLLDNKYRTSSITYDQLLGVVDAWAKKGFDSDPRAGRFSRLNQVDLDRLFGFIKAKVASQPLTFMIVGDRDKIDMKALARIGDVEEIDKGVLFTN